MATKVTTGLISADAALVDLNIDANTLYVDASADRVGMGTTSPASALHVKGDEVQIEDPGGGFKLHLNADTNPIKIIANDNTGANYCGFKLQTNNGGAYPVTAMDVYPHGAASVAFGAGARTDTQMLISRAPTSASQTTPETLLVLSTPCTSTSSNIPVGQGPRIVFEIPDDQSGNKATGAAIAAIKEVDADSNSQTSLAFYTSDDDETLDQRMTILSDGKVGIGETSPDLQLHVKSSGQIAKLETTASTGDCILTFADAAANKGFVGFGSSSSEIFQITNIENGDMKFDTNNTERMRIDSSGNVGIGDASPNTTLHVATGTDGSGLIDVLRVENSGDTVNDGPRIQLTAGQSTSGAGIGALGVSSNSAHLVLHAGGNNERMRIEADGDVGIGTTSPNAKLHVATTNSTTFSPSDSSWHTQVIKNDTGAASNASGLAFYTSANGYHVNAGTGIACVKNGTNSDYGSHLVFITRPQAAVAAERMRITDGGMVYMGTAGGSPSFTDGVLFTYKTDNNPHIENKVNHTNSMGLYKFQNSNGTAGSISMFSTSVSYNTSSDYRLKEDVNYTWDATSKLKQLKPCEFKFKADSDDVVHQGFLAHEVDDIVPTSVFGEKDGEEMQQLDHSKLVPLLVKTIQELEARIETLEG